MRKTHWVSLALALFVATLFALLEQQRGAFFLAAGAGGQPYSGWRRLPYHAAYVMQRAEWALLDERFKLRGERLPDERIIIIAVDEASLAALHQWPWPRSLHAALIRRLAEAPPKVLLFDILFLEPFSADPAGDRALVQATRQNPWVVHSFFFEVHGDQLSSVKLPFPELLKASANLGYVNTFVDEDGVLRSAVLQRPLGETRFSLLSAVGASVYLQEPVDEIARSVPPGVKDRMLLNFVGKAYRFPYVSYADVLAGKVPLEVFKDRIVLVGSTATGTYDHYPTPTSSVMPGVEFHANVIDNLLHSGALHYIGLRFTYGAIALFGLLCGLFLVRFSAWVGALWALGLAFLYAGTGQLLFSRHQLVIDMAGPLGTLGVGYVTIVIYRFFTEEKEKRWVKAAFGQYVSPKVLEILLADPSKLKLVGERREMTVFFSDVAGFTSIAERLNPDELVVLLNRYLSAMTEVIFRHDGYLNKYMGDGIMAFWNAPVKQDDHPVRACLCALESMERLKRLNLELEQQALVPLKARIGINSGMMVVGNMGSEQKSDYTVMGDHVNIASRLEGANKSFGTSIMISEFTYDLVPEQFEVRFLDIIRVPGKAKPIRTYELLGRKGALDGSWMQALPLYHEAIEEFGSRRFEAARAKFLEVLKILGHDKPCETYIQRAETFLAAPPPDDWDGVFDLRAK
jgi:adenylate cyclase